MMKEGLLDLNEAVQNPGKRLVFNFETELPQEEDLDLVEPVIGHIEAVSAGSQLLVSATCQAKCVLECSRCGSPIDVQIDFDMEDNFDVDGVPSCYASGSYAKIVDDEPYPLFKHNALVRDTYIRQGLWVNIPPQPLCSFGWEGPCPEAERVESLINQDEPEINAAFEKLQTIQIEDEK